MEKKINSRVNVILIIIAILLLIVPSVFYIINNHYSNLYVVLEKKIIEEANNCFNDGNCKEREITLEELIEKGYLEKMYDPITKELINLKSYVKIDSNEFKIVK